MKKLIIIFFAPLLLICSCKRNEIIERPNILLILADDMGYSDIGCYGGEINTPVLDGLAHEGIRFTQFYNTARCCPTRASLMTGLYPHEAGVGHLTGRNDGPGYMGYLNDSCFTIAEILSQNGYYTGMAGKWHAGNLYDSWPENRGFGRFFGIHNWVDSYFKVLEDCEVFEDGNIVIPVTADPLIGAEAGKEWYTTDVFTGKAIEFIDEAIEKGRPFFQYVAYNSPHWPLEAHDDVIAKYLDRYSDGYEELRKEKFNRMIELGLVSGKWNLPAQETPGWDELSDSAKLDTQFRRAVYAAQVEIMDRNIGRLVDHLKEQDLLDNTVIFFLSDNGCSAEPETNDFGYMWGENTRWNYDSWRRNSGREGASQGKAWSITSNSPFRKYKKFTHEGGISTPLIVHWPAGIRNSDRISDKPGHLVDIMATCLDLAGADYPGERNGVKVKPIRGISLKGDLCNSNIESHESLFWEHEGHAALRKGRWKIVTVNPKDIALWELYDMENDRTETNDLAQSYPELVKEMVEEWTKMAIETSTIPWPDRANGRVNPVDKGKVEKTD